MNKLNITKLYNNTDTPSELKLHGLKAKAASLVKFSPALLLAGVVPAEAQIICNDSAAPFVASGSYFSTGTATVDMDGDGSADFTMAAFTTFYSSAMGGVVIRPGNNEVIGELSSGGSFYTAANLSEGFAIGSSLPSGFNSSGSGTLAFPLLYSGTAVSWGNFIAPNNGYLGVSFDIGADRHFGWIELSTSGGGVFSGGGPGVITVEGFCYDSRPSTTIAAGSREIEIVPTMGEWGLITLNLLLMIFGVVAVRQKNGSLAMEKR